MSTAKSKQTVKHPDSFSFTAENMELARQHIAKYPSGRQASAVMPLLDLAQRQSGGWLPRPAMQYIAEMLDMAEIRVYEVASFYTMYNLQPIGKHFVQVCTTTPCWLRGSDQVMEACKSHLKIHDGETTADGQFTLKEVECLGACVNAPMVQINDDYYEDLDEQSMVRILQALAKGEKPAIGSQNGRLNSAPLPEDKVKMAKSSAKTVTPPDSNKTVVKAEKTTAEKAVAKAAAKTDRKVATKATSAKPVKKAVTAAKTPKKGDKK